MEPLEVVEQAGSRLVAGPTWAVVHAFQLERSEETRAGRIVCAMTNCAHASDQRVAAAAILFLYQKVLQVELPWLDGIVRPKQSRYLRVALTSTEVRAVLAHLKGECWLVGNLLYGAGLRLSEALQLRVKHIQFEYRQVIVRSATGTRDRSTSLPEILLGPLQLHLENVKLRHESALRNGHAGVELPFARERGYDMRTVWELLGHKDAKTTQIYTHVMRRGANAVQSPLDQ